MTSIIRNSQFLRHGVSTYPKGAVRLPYITKRPITQNFLQRKLEKEMEWQQQAEEIRAGKKQSMLSFLEERGLVKQTTGERDALDNLLTNKRIAVYCGIDPTAPSLHIGHMLPLMVCFWMYVHGFPTFTLVGGATARIGDPSGRTTSRDPMERSTRVNNLAMMHDMTKRLWVKLEHYASRHGYKDEKPKKWLRGQPNNSFWYTKATWVDILRELGTGVRLASMLGRDTVKTRMEKGSGMSFSEFCYPLMQTWDWWELFKQRGVQLQIGGSDQYGNLVAGVEGLNYLKANASHADDRVENPTDPLFGMFGLTTPLLTTPSGKKLGKSERNAIWLDPSLTSSFDLYQHFVRLPDSQVEQYLKWFTFVSTPKIKEIMEEHNKDTSQRVAQNVLAAEFVELVHGRPAAESAIAQTRQLYPSTDAPLRISDLVPNYNDTPSKPTPRDPKKEVPEAHLRKQRAAYSSTALNEYAPQTNAFNGNNIRVRLPRSLVMDNAFPTILHAAGLVASKSEGNRIIAQKGVYAGGAHGNNADMGDEIKWDAIRSTGPFEPRKYVIDNKVLLLRMGKWNIKAVEIMDDDEFSREGLTCVGFGQVDPVKALKDEPLQKYKPTT